MIVHVGGINGVGKTTVLSYLSASFPNFSHMRGSSLLMKALGIATGDYNKLRSLPDNIKNNAFGKIVAEYCRRYKNSETIVLLDAHYLNIVEGQVHSVVGPWLKHMDGLVLIEADLQSVVSRLIKNPTFRDRKLLRGEPMSYSKSETEKLERYMIKTRTEFKTLAEIYSLPSLLIKNQEGKIHSAATDIVNFCRFL